VAGRRAGLWLSLVCFILLHSALGPRAFGQTYSVDWYRISGGGVSASGQYAVSGTLGQHEAAGPMTGGKYSVTGGFWALVSVVQTAGLPSLAIALAGKSVVVSWPNTGGYALQQSSGPATGNWTASGYSITTANGTNSVTVTPVTRNLFFRLKQ
jgi:hypothetical protein